MFISHEANVFQKEKLAVLGELSAEIAHEIRNSLMSIGGFIQIMDISIQHHGREIIFQGLKRMERFLTYIREYARPSIRFSEVDITKLIPSVLELMGAEFKSTNTTKNLLDFLDLSKLYRGILIS